MFSHYRVKSFLIGMLLSSTVIIQAQDLEAELETAFDDLQLLGLSVGVSSSQGNQIFSFGQRDVARELPITNETNFRIASISKAFTALGILKLYDDGLLDLDTDISDYLGFQVRNPNFPNTTITTRMLLSHQSSLQDGTGYNDFLSATFSQNPIPAISELLLPSGNYYTPNMWRTESPSTYFIYSNLNYGVLGTLIEAVSNQRFDLYMKMQILEPLGIQGSFNIQDLNDINSLAVLYRFQNGTWQPQQDNFQGVMPPPPDLSGYTIGTNGLYFSPQGGLRCTTTDIHTFMRFLKDEGTTSPFEIGIATLQEMKAIAWNYNGNNGNTYGGLFNRWGLGLHHANVNPGDTICFEDDLGTFLGHPGEAYGLISDAFFSVSEDVQFSLLINGSRNGYQLGSSSSFYTIEESLFSILCAYFRDTLTTSEALENTVVVTPNPASQFIEIKGLEAAEVYWQISSVSGANIIQSDLHIKGTRIDVSSLSAGIYFLTITAPTFTLTKKIAVE